MQQSIDRVRLLAEVELRLLESPVTALLGARQTGKTTLARQVAKRFKGPVRTFDLEVATDRAALERTPELALADCTGLVIIDEVQRIPSLFETLRPLCDDPGRTAVFLLLGSASPDLVRGVSETLAGRVLFLPVPGFSLAEVDPARQDRLWLRGGFPRAFLADGDAAAHRWLESFRQSFLERDIPLLGSRVPSATLERFWTMLAHFHGQIWNAAELGRSMPASPLTVNRYRDLLAGTYMLRILPPWFENTGKRQVRSPKVYLRDSGLLHNFLRIAGLADLRSHPRYGASWEGFAIEQTLIRFGGRDAYFWATQRGAELDLLLMRDGRRYGFECKCADAPTVTRSMHIAMTDLGLEHLWVLYPGRERYPLAKGISALPLAHLPALELST